MSKVVRLVSFMACIVMSVTAIAVPIRRDTRTVMQPDGTRLTVTAIGDEYGWCHITADGVPIVQGVDGGWKYAGGVRDGSLISGPMLAHDMEDRTVSEKEWISSIAEENIISKVIGSERQLSGNTYALSARAGAAPGAYALGNYPRTGKQKCLMVLVEFPDQPFSRSNSDILQYYDMLFNKPGFSEQINFKGNIYQTQGSVKDFFEKQSFGQFSPEFTVIGPIMADSSYAFYGSNKGGSTDRYESNLAQEIIRKIITQNLADFTEYSSHHNSVVDFLGIIYAGRGENYAGADPNTIWPHKHSIVAKIGPVTNVTYFMTCELFWDSEDIIDGIGPLCHEFSHILGLPDFYDIGQHFILGKWSLMDYGPYTAEGFVPSGLTAFERYSLGWMDLTEISDPGTYWLEDLQEGKAFRLSTDDPNRFLIIENHQQEEWFRYQEASGLMLTQMNYSSSAWSYRPNNSQKRYKILAADNIFSYESEYGDLYPYNGKDSVTWFSKPALAIDDQIYQGLQIYNIRNQDGYVSFTLGNSEPSGVLAVSDGISIHTDGSAVIINAPAGTAVGLYDISGKAVITHNMTGSQETLQLPDRGAWIIRCGNVTRKISW